MKKAMNIIGKVVTGLLVVLLVFNLYFVITSKIAGGEPQVFGNQLMTVLSGSMSPVFETGDLIAVKPGTLQTEYGVGDVITFRSADDSNVIITHRILEVTEQNGGKAYITKGDANESTDPSPVVQAQVIGKYSDFHIPNFGYVMSFVKSKMGMALLLIIPGILLIVGPLIGLVRLAIKGAEVKEEVKEAVKEA